MGDRGNIQVTQNNKSIFFYTHWCGSTLPAVLAAALRAGQDRWGDPAYLNRIIFQRMLGSDNSTTGFGISTDLGDNEHPILKVNHDAKTVTIGVATWSFSEFTTQRAKG